MSYYKIEKQKLEQNLKEVMQMTSVPSSPTCTKPMLAEVFQLSHGVGFKIPKRRGIGFVKSCTGWHSLNKEGKLLQELLNDKKYIDSSCGDFSDIDGYLFISVKSEFMCYTDKADKIQEELQDIILKVFPFVTGFTDGCP